MKEGGAHARQGQDEEQGLKPGPKAHGTHAQSHQHGAEGREEPPVHPVGHQAGEGLKEAPREGVGGNQKARRP